ncbi:peptidoglycan-binding domain-containing protein [Brunnivagina elsteri]|uniref:Peptidoglycan-binding protein n=1 Tax=Brunnivagina elsteri CCALA 953 TaxID=987040 RepID=A0A2A2TKG0_9CYAN|nr:peptidoglycan-binding domain-containing protein [Calothrix elsteri]PAX56511.1 peptidoglycan-binding protein [Calothrix elsteri CCALA 953]
MSDIGLLMTGMFAIARQYQPNLPEQLLLHESSFLEEKSTRLIKSTLVVQSAPPEFTQIGGTFSTELIVPNLKFKNILNDFAYRIRGKNFSGTQLNPVNEVVNINLQPQIFADVGSSEIIGSRKFQRLRSPSLPMLQFNNSGISVRVLQKLLVSNGYTVGVDGFFGALTESAVKAFQNQRNLVADGIVGTKTWDELTK